MRLAWGKTQEAAALHSILKVMPGSVMEEVGLFATDALQLPGSCLPGAGQDSSVSDAGGGGEGGSGEGGASGGGGESSGGDLRLPPLGASPDALICHRLAFSSGEVLAAAAELRALAGGRGGPGGARAEAARNLLRLGLSRLPAGGDCGADGGVGGASPCGGLDASPVVERVAAFIERTAAQLEAAAAGGGEPSSSGDGGGGGGDERPHVIWVREVVEVKNHCPFVFK